MAKALVYLAPGFEEVEFVTVVDILRRADIETHVISLNERLEVLGAHAMIMRADFPFSAAEDWNSDIIILPGGGPGTQALKASKPLQDRLHKQFVAQQRVAAICAAPTVLAQAGLLQGKHACCYPGCETELEQGGAIVIFDSVKTDGLITTSRGAGTSAKFALEIVTLLTSISKANEIGKAMLYPA
jgi:4-methyl-5(b-hydroxyethyl)-thiazole monophosphate biosynthesis